MNRTSILALFSILLAAAPKLYGQTDEIRLCVGEVNYGGRLVPRPPPAQPFAISRSRIKPEAVISVVHIKGRPNQLMEKARENKCDFNVLTWWVYHGIQESRPSTKWPSNPFPTIDDSAQDPWNRPMQSAPDIPTQNLNARWTRQYEFDLSATGAVITAGSYAYSQASGARDLREITDRMITDVVGIIESRPRIVARETSSNARSLGSIQNRVAAAPHSERNAPSHTLGTSDNRRKLLLPNDGQQPSISVVVNGHQCSAGDQSKDCNSVCGGSFGSCQGATQEKRKAQFILAYRLLLKHGVPFDPYLLSDKNGPEKVKPFLELMPEMHENQRVSTLNGIVLADTLYVRENATIILGPVIVIANHIVYEGCPNLRSTSGGNVWGTDGLYVFELGPSKILGMTIEDALARVGADRDLKRDGLPTFTEVKDFDLPKPYCSTVRISTGGQSADSH